MIGVVCLGVALGVLLAACWSAAGRADRAEAEIERRRREWRAGS